MIVLPLPGNEALAGELAAALDAQLAQLETRRFPDGETYVRLHSDVAGQAVVLLCTLADPDSLFLPLHFAAETARRSGAASITLVAPYLAYMRQDMAFAPGEAVTSEMFAELLGRAFDRIVTVDPHLHRHRSLGEIFLVPADVVHSAPLIAGWIAQNVERPLILGPDEESGQWVERIGALIGAPFATFRKHRLGDRSVRLEAPDFTPWSGYRPVLVDDIVSTGSTIIEAARITESQGFPAPPCLAVHGLFDEVARRKVESAVADLVTTDSVPNPCGRLRLAPLIAEVLGARVDAC